MGFHGLFGGGLIASLIVGLGILFLVDYLDLMAIDIGLIEILIVVILGGVPGAIVVMLLVYFDIL
jgi:hypothetical protein